MSEKIDNKMLKLIESNLSLIHRRIYNTNKKILKQMKDRNNESNNYINVYSTEQQNMLDLEQLKKDEEFLKNLLKSFEKINEF